MSRSARVLVCFLGMPPQELRMPSDPGLPGHLGGLIALLGGPVDEVSLDGGVRLWRARDAAADGLPLNRCLPTDPRLPARFQDADPGQLAADLARSAWLRVHGTSSSPGAARRRGWQT